MSASECEAGACSDCPSLTHRATESVTDGSCDDCGGDGHDGGLDDPRARAGVPVPNGKLGMWLFLGTEIMFFTAFIGSYIVVRIGSPLWPTDPHVTHINVLLGGINTFVLICSSVTVVLAHEALGHGRPGKATGLFAVTLGLALVFLGIKAVEYKGKFDHDILPGRIAETTAEALMKLDRDLERAAESGRWNCSVNGSRIWWHGVRLAKGRRRKSKPSRSD